MSHSTPHAPSRRPWLAAVLGVVLSLGAIGTAIVAWPPSTSRLASRAEPSAGHAESVARFARLAALEDAPLRPECRTVLLDHGHRTARAWVIVHGLTNCPQQFRRLGERLHACGDNVLIVRLPHHGRPDRRGADLAELTAGELARTMDHAIDLAAGLGDSVELIGLSLGASAVAWSAQSRGDVARAVLLAPMIGLHGLPASLTTGATRLMTVLPNQWVWWDAKVRDRLGGPEYAYARFSTRARSERAAVPRIVVIDVEGDTAVHAAATDELVRDWRRHGTVVDTHVFPKALAMPHDFIDPLQPEARVDQAYDSLFTWLRLGTE